MVQIHSLLREIHQVGKQTREWIIQPGPGRALQRHRTALAGISHAVTGFRFVRPAPKIAQVLVCFRGEGRIMIEGRWHRCGSGMAYLTPPAHFHAYESGRRWEIGWVCYQGAGPFPPTDVPRLIEVDPRPFEHVLRGFHHEQSGERDPARIEWWGQLLHRYALQMVAPGHRARLWRLWQAVQADLGAEWTLEKLARLASLGPEQVRRLSLRETGRSPLQQVTHLRMEYAASLVTAGRKIEEIAHLAGYANAFAFSTAFRRHHGQPPSQWRVQ